MPLPPAAPPLDAPLVLRTKQGHTTQSPTLPPTLQHIVPEDLRDTARLLALFEQAQRHGLIGPSDSARLTFLATAEHAWVIGSTNPCGLFAALIRRQRWHYVTESDEDAASLRLKQHLYGWDTQPACARAHGTAPPPSPKMPLWCTNSTAS